MAVVAASASACAHAQPPAGDATQLNTYTSSPGAGFSVQVSPYGTVDPSSSYTPDTLTCAGASLGSCTAANWASWAAPGTSSSAPATTDGPRAARPVRPEPASPAADPGVTDPPVAGAPPPTDATTVPPPVTVAPTPTTLPTTTTTRPPRAGKKH